LRRATADFLHDVERDFRDTTLLVVSELCTNAIEALANPRAKVTLRIKELDDRIQIEVEDSGPGFRRALNRPGSGEDDPRGRGLQVVRSLVDEFAVRRRQGRTKVTCVIYRR
jgi:anti-sigma regulatory factor (Ser/Thr protein kinase)